MTPSFTIFGLILFSASFFAGVDGNYSTVWQQSSELAARSRAASRAMSQGRFDEAARIYQELSHALPDDPGLLMNLGMALAMGGHESEAIPPLERAVSLNATLVPAHLFLGSSYLAVGEPLKAIPPLERAVAGGPKDVERRQLLAQAYAAVGRPADAVTELRTITQLDPRLPAAWFALGHAYNELAQEAMATFSEGADEGPWRQLLVGDALFVDGRFTDAFAIYREALDQLPAMATIHDSIAQIYAKTGHADWAARERLAGVVSPAACAKRKAMCEFRAARFRTALSAALSGRDPESRYWRVRAATELARAAFKRLDTLPDSRERRQYRSTVAMAERRYADAIVELKAALKFAPGDPALVEDLGSAYYYARDYDNAASTLAPLLKTQSDTPTLLVVYGDSLAQLQRVDEGLPLLRRAVELSPGEAAPALTLARAYLQKGEFAAATPLLEPQLEGDEDGSLHVQLARAYTGLGQKEKAETLLKRSQELQRAAQARNAAAAQRTITPPR
ncbi:MAG: tetratricopeptide repeat protein [Vicinamibacterales bacterium]